MSGYRVLVDLVFAHNKIGFSGIPQDCRFLFDGLSQSQVVTPVGFIWSNQWTWRGGPLTELEEQSVFLGFHVRDSRPRIAARLAGLLNSAWIPAVEVWMSRLRPPFNLHEVENEHLKDIIWRVYFSSALPPQRRAALLAQKYVIGDMGLGVLSQAALGKTAAPKLDTTGYDFAIFHDSRKIKVSPGTTKVIRYHDGIPILASDTFPREGATRLHIRAVRACAEDSIFVCNSPSARDDLAHLSRLAAERAQVIPYFVPRMEILKHRHSLESLANGRVSPSSLEKLDAKAVIENWFRSARTSSKTESSAERVPDFIMTLSVIEPRKNMVGLIRGWQRLRNATGRDIKLLIIGKPGWTYEPTLKEVKLHVASGTLLHLENVPQAELPAWYKAAKCFAFLSFAEGFGLPPIEAMQCGCPVLASDIPAHRYSAGDAAMYCDPYDHAEIAAMLDKITNPKNAGEIAERVERGYKNADRFTLDAVLPQWEGFFAAHKRTGH